MLCEVTIFPELNIEIERRQPNNEVAAVGGNVGISSNELAARLRSPLSMTKRIIAPLQALAQITTPFIRNTRFRGSNFGISFGSTSLASSRQNSCNSPLSPVR